ncbi:MAG: nitrite/sulfite reductase [Burkholderiales bacterium]
MLNNLANIEEIDYYERSLRDFQDGQIDVDRFTAIRLQQGIYGQRQEGVNMVRIKLPGGLLTPAKLNAIADVLERYSEHDSVHITTRQDIQMHYVPLGKTPEVLRHLAKFGVTTREACGNTIRNVTACVLAGVCPRQHVDVNEHLDGAVAHFLRNPLNQQLPRKFKISFSACESDCAQAIMHDLGIVAVKRDGRFGFRVTAGGGLGHKPHEAIVIEPFIEERELLFTMEAVVALHNKYSDRVKRAKSRIKFLVDRFGPEGFIEKYREELAKTREALAEQPYPKAEWKTGATGEAPGQGAPRKIFRQKQPGLYAFPIAAPIGQLTAKQMRGVADLMQAQGLDQVRTTQDQNLVLLSVPEEKLPEIRARLAELELREPQRGDNVVACPGTSTCRLGITSSTVLGPKLDGGPLDLRIRVSGCHNGCAQPETGDIGIYGEGKRMHGKLIPHYQTYFGGSGIAGGGLAVKGPSIPAARIETAVARVKQTYAGTRLADESFFNWTRRQGQEYFKALLEDLTAVSPDQVAEVLRDHGDTQDFKVLQLGGGECAGASQVKVGSNFFDAAHERNYRDALKFQRKFAESVNCAEAIAKLIGQGMVHLIGGKMSDDLSELAREIDSRLLGQGDFARQLSTFKERFSAPAEELNDVALSKLFGDLDAWTVAAAENCQRFDRQLDLSGALPKSAMKPVRSPQAELVT